MRPLILCCVLFANPGVALAQQPEPVLFVSANATGTLTLYRGWPLVVQLTIMNSTRDASDGTAAPVTLSPNGHVWTDAIHFQVVSSSGQPVEWPLTLVGSAREPALTLQPDGIVRATYQMSADDVSRLALDSYQVTP